MGLLGLLGNISNPGTPVYGIDEPPTRPGKNIESRRFEAYRAVLTQGTPPSSRSTDPLHHQGAYCKACDYFKEFVVQNPGGDHGCMQCGGLMSVWIPRP